MRFYRRINFRLGGIFSLIVAYLIHLYAKSQGWTLLALIAGAYVIVNLAIIGIIFLIILIPLLIIALLLLNSKLKRKKPKKDYIDVEYKVK